MSSADVDSDLIPADEWYDPYLRFALYLGGAFQLLCIIAVLVLPSEGATRNTLNLNDDGDDFDSEDESSTSEEEDATGANVGKTSRHRQQNRSSKKVDKRSKKQR